MTPEERAARALRHVPMIPTARPAAEAMVEVEIRAAEQAARAQKRERCISKISDHWPHVSMCPARVFANTTCICGLQETIKAIEEGEDADKN